MGTNARKRRVFVKQAILLLVAVVAIWFGYDAFGRQLEDRDLLATHFELPSGAKTPKYHLRIAKNASERQQGLMYVKERDLEGGHGMIFIFPEEKTQSFWMKNTPSPLDMVFLNQKREVVGVVENAKPYSTDMRSVGVPSMFVVELLGGTVARDGISKGAKLSAEAQLPPAE